MDIAEIVDLERFGLDRPGSADWQALAARARADLAEGGMFNLDALVRPGALAAMLAEIMPVIETASFRHRRRHNIYFKPEIEGLAPGHPALAERETSNRTVCADQIASSALIALYEWPPLARFLAETMAKPVLHPMADPLARVNVMAYGPGEALNWHFDRAEFTTTLLLQAPEAGGVFEYRTGLRSDTDPNYAGVAEFLEGRDAQVERIDVAPGTLNVFRGRNTAHRITPVEGAAPRVIAVFSYFERPGVTFSDEERIGFYGRAA